VPARWAVSLQTSCVAFVFLLWSCKCSRACYLASADMGCVSHAIVDALFVLHRLAVLGLQLYNVHLTALERANLPFLVLAVALLCRGPLGSYVLSRRRAKASASRLDFILRPGLGCLVTLNVGYCAGLLFQRHELHYSLLLLLPLLARQLLFGGAAGSAFGGWYRDVMPHGMRCSSPTPFPPAFPLPLCVRVVLMFGVGCSFMFRGILTVS
jgi:hypothetical protein